MPESGQNTEDQAVSQKSKSAVLKIIRLSLSLQSFREKQRKEHEMANR
jgi:hypothetical protein